MSEARRPIRVNRAARAADGERRRARTRERLLDAAEALIAEAGTLQLSIEAFARAADVSRGTFYNYFPTTTELLDALNRRVATHMAGLLAAIAERPADPATRLAASLHTVLAAYLAEPVRSWVAFQLASSRAPRQRTYERVFEALYREGVALGQFHDTDIGAAITLCFGTVRMAQRDAVAGAPPAQLIPVVALLLRAFGVPPGEAERISRQEAAAAAAR